MTKLFRDRTKNKLKFSQRSLQVLENVMVDRSVANAPPLSRFQFERVGYFCVDYDSTEGKVSACTWSCSLQQLLPVSSFDIVVTIATFPFY